MTIDAEVWTIANRVCTPAELRALRKREDLHRRNGMTWQALADELDCSLSAARARVLRAEEKIRAASLEVETPRCQATSPLDGRPCILEQGHKGWCVVSGIR